MPTGAIIHYAIENCRLKAALSLTQRRYKFYPRGDRTPLFQRVADCGSQRIGKRLSTDHARPAVLCVLDGVQSTALA